MNDLKDIVEQIGSFAGFAAVVGIAVLALLYFSQARDVRRLREWAGRAPERDAEVEQRAAQLASNAVAAAYQTVASPSQIAAQEAAAVQPQAALQQAEVHAAVEIGQETQEWQAVIDPETGELIEHQPVTSSETGEFGAAHPAVDPETGEPIETQPAVDPETGELIEPHPVEVGVDGEPVEAAEMPASDAELVEAMVGHEVAENGAEAGVGQAGEIEHDQALAAQAQPAATEASSEFAAVANSEGAPATDDHTVMQPPDQTGEPVTSRLAPSTPAAAMSGAGGIVGARAPLPPRPLPPVEDDSRVFAASSTPLTARSRRQFEDEPERRPKALFYIAGTVVVVFGVLLAVTQLGGGPSATPDQSATTEKPQTNSQTNPQINRKAVQVTVLNGTRQTGLGAYVGDRVNKAGFKLRSVGDRSDGQIHNQSEVFYAAGNKLEAKEVAKELRISKVSEIDPQTSAAAGNAPVVVLVGSDTISGQ